MPMVGHLPSLDRISSVLEERMIWSAEVLIKAEHGKGKLKLWGAFLENHDANPRSQAIEIILVSRVASPVAALLHIPHSSSTTLCGLSNYHTHPRHSEISTYTAGFYQMIQSVVPSPLQRYSFGGLVGAFQVLDPAFFYPLRVTTNVVCFASGLFHILTSAQICIFVILLSLPHAYTYASSKRACLLGTSKIPRKLLEIRSYLSLCIVVQRLLYSPPLPRIKPATLLYSRTRGKLLSAPDKDINIHSSSKKGGISL
ncbi:hypothetical protein P175DRAFT_0530366 [Aspergillus ochraceoroseus IBT 24754]|uniref:Uncharacterized protein n=1 Tax=Aspergillus ochraceoroseus IBT 24754 TaxID=1392256 RepID=A0A2T5M3Y8_9EURO|nr:uncharacterized protein P175DRAFT_0530366 [Aspergillus ochraceoroseus IBT 24754]PTU23258.1 hypothetical protein P175DRAFT_0530366 [Aspergillus ochraceoroseus IBT 24754]